MVMEVCQQEVGVSYWQPTHLSVLSAESREEQAGRGTESTDSAPFKPA